MERGYSADLEFFAGLVGVGIGDLVVDRIEWRGWVRWG